MWPDVIPRREWNHERKVQFTGIKIDDGIVRRNKNSGNGHWTIVVQIKIQAALVLRFQSIRYAERRIRGVVIDQYGTSIDWIRSQEQFAGEP